MSPVATELQERIRALAYERAELIRVWIDEIDGPPDADITRAWLKGTTTAPPRSLRRWVRNRFLFAPHLQRLDRSIENGCPLSAPSHHLTCAMPERT